MKELKVILIKLLFLFLISKITFAGCNVGVLYQVSWCQVGQQRGCSDGAWCASCAQGVYYCIRCDSTGGSTCAVVCPGGEVPTCQEISGGGGGGGHPCGSCIPSSCGGGRVSLPSNYLASNDFENNKNKENQGISFNNYFSILKNILTSFIKFKITDTKIFN